MTIIRHNNHTALCRKCGQWHKLEYQIQKNNTKHLVYRCVNKKGKKQAAEFLSFIDNLPIPSYHSTNPNIKQLNLVGE